MSYNGSGTFQINTSGQPVVAGTVISSTAFNALTADLATGLSTAITKDGQTTTTVRIPFAAGINSSLATDSSSTSTGSIITAGGVGIAKNLYVGVNANIAGTLSVTGSTTLTNPVINNIKMGYSTTATAAGTTTLTVSSNYRQFFTGTLAQTVVLPVTSTLVTGMAFEIENNSTGLITVNSSGGNLVGTIPAGVCAHAVCIGTTLTTAADWDWNYISTSTITGTGANVLGTSPTITSATLVTPALGTPASGSLVNCTDLNYTGYKNRIINGAMVIDQRNAGASVTPTSGQFITDRWKYGASQTSKFTSQQSTTAPTGFINSLLFTSSSAYSVLAGDYFAFNTPIEGLNVSDLAWGTASAATITVSFWVRSSLTGTFAGVAKNSASSRSYPFTYTISSANTFEQKSVTIAGDTSGTWLTTNGIGIQLLFSLGTGSTYSGTAGAWVGSDIWGVTGATSVVGTNGATFYVTGVQLEKGSTATSFDYRPYQTELALAQRYYAKFSSLSGVYVGFGSGVSTATTSAAIVVKYPVRMRAAPTLSQSNAGLYDGGSIPAVTSVSGSYYGDESVFANITVASGLTLGRGCILCGANNASAYIDLSAEL